MKLYWMPRVRFAVTVHLHEDLSYEWRRMFGIGIGRWFIGAIKGDPTWKV